MGALSHYIERSGVATTSISLIRRQSERMRTPRALWVPYDLGRPLGSAEDPEFQKDVMRAAFGILESATEPTIVDYGVEAPNEVGPEQWACPLNLGPSEDASLRGRLAAEVARLQPWSSQTRAARGRTLFGVSGAAPDAAQTVASALADVAESGDVMTSPGTGEWAFEMPLLLRHLADDLRTHYHEALAAQPGSAAPNHDALNAWIFGGTALGDTLLEIAAHLTAAGADNRMATLVRGLMIPEGHYPDGPTFGDH